jgi:putative PEP-CTERM system TPR-repeat lipoprotein
MRCVWLLFCKFTLLVILSVGIAACGKTEVSDTEHVTRAKALKSKGDVKATLIELKNALQKNPDNPEARLLLGELYIEIGNGEAAEKELSRASDLGVTGPYMQKLKGESLLLQRKYNEVLSTLKSLDVENSAELQVLSGDAQRGLRRAGLARYSYNQALALQANNIDALLGIASLDIQGGNIGTARSEIADILALSPKNIEALILQGTVNQREGHIGAALDSYRQAVHLLQSNNLVTRLGMVARTSLAKLLISESKYDEAKEYVDYLLKAAPNHPKPSYMAGLLAYEQKNYQLAQEYFHKVLKLDPNHLPSLFLLGAVNMQLGNIEQAELQLSRVLAEKPNLLSARLLLAKVRLRQAQSDQALELIEPVLEQHPEDARLLALAGQVALRSGNLDQGKSYLQSAIQQRPADNTLRGQLAMLYLAEGNERQAIEELEDIVAKGKAPQREQALLVISYIEGRKYDNAVKLAKSLVAKSPNNAFPLNLLGVAYNAKGEIALARQSFLDALVIDKSFIPSLLNLARLDAVSGRRNDAMRRLEQVLARDEKNVSAMVAFAQLVDAENDREQALLWLEKARKMNKNALSPRLILARYYGQLGQLQKASEILRESVDIDPKNVEAVSLQGRIQLAMGDVSTAIQTFSRLLQLDDSASSYYLLAEAKFTGGEALEAEKYLLKALGKDPRHLKAASLLVALYSRAGNINAALKRISKIKQYHPKSPAGNELEGDILAQQHKLSQAAASYQQARLLGGGIRVLVKEADILMESKGPEAVIKLLSSWLDEHEEDIRIRYLLAGTYVKVSKYPNALDEYQHILKLMPDYVPALNDLAWLYVKEDEKLSLAEQSAERAYELQPNNATVLDTLGWIRLKQGDPKSALTLLRQASEKLPDSQEVGYHLAVALMRSGKKTESKHILDGALKGGEFPSRKEAIKLFESLK